MSIIRSEFVIAKMQFITQPYLLQKEYGSDIDLHGSLSQEGRNKVEWVSTKYRPYRKWPFVTRQVDVAPV